MFEERLSRAKGVNVLMNLKKVALVGLVISASLALSGCDLLKGKTRQMQPEPQIPVQKEASSASKETGNQVIIAYSESGFAPANVSVKVGDRVVFRNNATSTVQVNSEPHPTHTEFPELNLNGIAAGQNKSVVFSKPGVYKYHNHLEAGQKGTIVVE